VNYYLDRSRFIYANDNEVIPNDGFQLDRGIQYVKNSTMNPVRMHYKRSSAATLDFINGTRNSISFENQYYLPTFELWKAIHTVARRARVTVITNTEPDTSYEQADRVMKLQTDRRIEYDAKHYGIQFLQLARIGALRREGASTNTADKDWYIHSKTAVRDHQDVMVGSFNLDSRSYSINVEHTTVVKQCPELARAIEAEYIELTTRYFDDWANCPSCRPTKSKASLIEVLLGIVGTGIF
jgi:phosphatidylserine/phosphatidylglycerophosphate/cardiolipin synthase-like enzyme